MGNGSSQLADPIRFLAIILATGEPRCGRMERGLEGQVTAVPCFKESSGHRAKMPSAVSLPTSRWKIQR